MPLSTIAELTADLRAGKMIVLADDENRENEGDLVCAAEFAAPEAVNFMATHARGWICLALPGETCDRLGLPPMVASNRSLFQTGFTVTIEAARGVGTGISAGDRSRTMRLAARPDAQASDFVRPGHVQPIRAREGGSLVRAGQTEGSIDLCRLAGLEPAAVICEIMNPDGTMARMPQLAEFCGRHGLKLGTVAQIIAHRRKAEKLVHAVASARMPTPLGPFMLHAYHAPLLGESHYALTLGDLRPGGPALGDPVLCRVHSECLTGDVFGSLRCDCGGQLEQAMRMVAEAGRGVVLYLRQEGRGIGLDAKLKAYALQEKGLDTVEANLALGLPADARDYALGAQILVDLGLRRLRLMTNNPVKLEGLEDHGLRVVERVPIVTAPRDENRDYLEAKRTKMGHMLDADHVPPKP